MRASARGRQVICGIRAGGHFPCATGRLRRRLVMPDYPPALAPRNIRIDQVLESMTQYYRLLVKQGIAGIAAAPHNGSGEFIGKILRGKGEFRQEWVSIAFPLTVEGFGQIWCHAMHGYSPF